MILCVCDDLGGGLAASENALYIEMCECSAKKIAQQFLSVLFTIWRVLYVEKGNFGVKTLCQRYGEPSCTETSL